jgi:hypothetical protein
MTAWDYARERGAGGRTGMEMGQHAQRLLENSRQRDTSDDIDKRTLANLGFVNIFKKYEALHSSR